MTRMLENIGKAYDFNNNIKNDFENIYIITYDFINSLIYFVSLRPYKLETIKCSNDDIGFIDIFPHSYGEMADEERYLLICKNIFNEDEILYYSSGKELRVWVNEMKIIY